MARCKRQWRGHEIEELWNRYPAEGPKQLAADLGRTAGSIDAMAARFRLRSLGRRDRQSQTRRERNCLITGAKRDRGCVLTKDAAGNGVCFAFKTW